MRVFAGPNGSGKTTIFKGILNESKVNLGIYVNADEIEETLRKNSSIDFSKFQLQVSEEQVKEFFRLSTFSPIKRNEPNLYTTISVEHSVFSTTATVDSYLSADLAEFIRQELLANDISFTYETVMSHPDKIQFLKKAQLQGFRVYLYYIATEDPEINISRVNVRVAQHGHNVHPDVIKNRYYKSLNNLKAAVKQSNRAYIFDNTHTATIVAEIKNGIDVVSNTATATPNWVVEYLNK